MKKESKRNDWSNFVSRIADYIDLEYGGFDADMEMTNDEKHTIKAMTHQYFYSNDSVNNAANDIMTYLRTNRQWKQNHGIHQGE